MLRELEDGQRIMRARAPLRTLALLAAQNGRWPCNLALHV